MWKSFFICVLLSLVSSSVFAQKITWNTFYRENYALLWEMRLNEVRENSQAKLNSQTDQLNAHYLLAFSSFLEIFAREEYDFYQSELSVFNEHQKSLSFGNDMYTNAALAETHLMKAALRAKFKENIKAGWEFWKAYRLIKSNYNKNPDFIPNKLMWGIIQAGIGSLPTDLNRYLSFIGFTGDVELGLGLMKEAFDQTTQNQQEYDFIRPLAALTYTSSRVQLANDLQFNIQKLGVKVNHSPLLMAVEGKILLDQNEPEAALTFLTKRNKSKSIQSFPYLSYLEGRALVTLQDPKAETVLFSYLKEYRGEYFIKSTHRYLWWHFFLKGDKTEAEKHRNWITEKGSNHTGPDEQALYESQFALNKTLLEARLQFDAGEYARAVRTLAADSQLSCCPEEREKMEYHYRYGRSLQLLGKKNSALEQFEKTCRYDKLPHSFEQANAYLQSGLLYESLGNCTKAKDKYSSATSMKKFPFYEGIHQKAKAGIQRCNKK